MRLTRREALRSHAQSKSTRDMFTYVADLGAVRGRYRTASMRWPKHDEIHLVYAVNRLQTPNLVLAR